MAHEYRPAPMSLAQRAALRQQEPRVLRQPARRRVFPLIILLVVLAVLVVAAGAFEYLYRDRIYPKVEVITGTTSINVGGLTRAAAAAQLQPLSIQQRFRPITLVAPGHASIVVQAYQLGYNLDGSRTIGRAYTIGRDGSLLHRFTAQVKLFVNGAQVSLVQRLDSGKLIGRLFSWAPQVAQPARPGRAGRRLNVVLAERRLASRLLHTIGPFTLRLPFLSIRALPAPRPAHRSPVSKHTAKKSVKKKH